MQSIVKSVEHTIIIQKSKFITYLFPIFEMEEIHLYIEKIRKKEKGASHVCFAYRFGALEKCSDDGEPSSTAGIPILNILKQKDLCNILCIVVRYFGGVKLGVGGLYRAYTNASKGAILLADVVSLITGYKIEIVFSYSYIKQIDNLLLNVNITQKCFNEDIFYTFFISKEKYEVIQNQLSFLSKKVTIIKELLLASK